MMKGNINPMYKLSVAAH